VADSVSLHTFANVNISGINTDTAVKWCYEHCTAATVAHTAYDIYAICIAPSLNSEICNPVDLYWREIKSKECTNRVIHICSKR